ncbi:hypothetical protein [Ralstonia solanacearum]|uniref:Uncharacterized protein n=1 Tax=Ralstonia solanacearum TaxID=305 RepID=A0AAD0WJE0_RALSL|nr:hypothetical protein [Ralstonia solanacearum]AXV84332.1 hypothetical protein CJO77_22795 [Ralstonia solanacearum]AXW55466.1 hypothetical protein CJO92_22810 [Ralstonia solanacearum]
MQRYLNCIGLLFCAALMLGLVGTVAAETLALNSAINKAGGNRHADRRTGIGGAGLADARCRCVFRGRPVCRALPFGLRHAAPEARPRRGCRPPHALPAVI